MVDNEGRWLYASPSYERVLERADLEPGADAFLRVHPDDAARARMAVAASRRPADRASSCCTWSTAKGACASTRR